MTFINKVNIFIISQIKTKNLFLINSLVKMDIFSRESKMKQINLLKDFVGTSKMTVHIKNLKFLIGIINKEN